MKTVQRFTTFDDLKSAENKTIKNCTSGLKKHDDFKSVMMDIRSVKVQKNKPAKPQ